jgi:hypothetical protein
VRGEIFLGIGIIGAPAGVFAGVTAYAKDASGGETLEETNEGGIVRCEEVGMAELGGLVA